MSNVRTRIIVSLYRIYDGELVVEQEKEWTPPASCTKSAAAMLNVTAAIEAALEAFRRLDDVVYVEEDGRGNLKRVGETDHLLIGSSVECVKFHLIPRKCQQEVRR
jgi:hypothetical protein